MAKKVVKSESQFVPVNSRREGRRLIGAALKQIREQAGLSVRDVDGLFKVTMLRMIESGNAPFPAAKIDAYVNQLNKTGNIRVDGASVALACRSISAYESKSTAVETSSFGRFDWPELLSDTESLTARNRAVATILGEFIRSIDVTTEPQAVSTGYFPELNPIQSALIETVAAKIQTFSSNVVTDVALSEWESLRLNSIVSVSALCTSLGSELKGDFNRTFLRAPFEDTFLGFRYLVHGEKGAVSRAWRKFLSQLKDVAKTEYEGPERVSFERKVKEKFHCRTVDLKAFAGVANQKWDGFYLYQTRRPQSDLLVGTFRKVAGPAMRYIPPTLENWNADPMNETLPSRIVSPFHDAFETAWEAAKNDLT